MKKEIKDIAFMFLKTGEKIISEFKQIVPDDIGEPDCKLFSPIQVEYNKETKSYDLTPWLFVYVDQQEFMINSDSILTMSLEVNEELKNKYLEYTSDF